MCCVFFSVERGCFLISKAYWKMKLNTIIAAQSVMFNANFIWFKKTKTTKKTKQHRKYTSQIIKTTFFFLFFNIIFFSGSSESKNIHYSQNCTYYLLFVLSFRVKNGIRFRNEHTKATNLYSPFISAPATLMKNPCGPSCQDVGGAEEAEVQNL